MQLQESLLVVARDDAPASLALEVLEALRAAEPAESKIFASVTPISNKRGPRSLSREAVVEKKISQWFFRLTKQGGLSPANLEGCRRATGGLR